MADLAAVIRPAVPADVPAISKAPSATGLGYDNNYAPVTLGPDGTAYVGVPGALGGLVSISAR